MSTNDDIKKAEELKTKEELEKSRVKFNELVSFLSKSSLLGSTKEDIIQISQFW